MIDAAIVGIGRWGRVLVDSVQGKSDAIRFTAGLTRTRSKAEDYCRDQGIDLRDDFEAILGDESIDAVVLATPHTYHAEQIAAAAAAGKHVFTEKPFALDTASAAAAVAACAKAGVALGLGHNRRFCANTIELKRMIEAGELGTLMHVESNFSANMAAGGDTWRDSRAESPAGGMTSLGIHALDTLIHLCGRIADVDARSQRRAIPYDIDDTTAMLFGFENGMSGYLGTMAASGRLWHVRVFGADGWAELRGLNTLVKTPVAGKVEVIDYPPEESVKAQLESFAAAASGGPAFIITPDEMVHGVAVLEAIIASVDAGNTVSIA